MHRCVEVIGQRCFEAFPFACARMFESELPRVQHLPRQLLDSFRSVNLVAQNRVTEVMKMHTDLVGPTTVDAAFHQTGMIPFPRDSVLGPGRPPA